MSTHSTLGVRHSDGKITGCYVHYDGVPRRMMPAIEDYVDRFTTTGLVTLIVQAQTCGGIRSFNAVDPKGSLFEGTCTDFLNDDEPYIIDELNFYDDHMGTFAWYLVDYKTGEIEMTEKWESER